MHSIIFHFRCNFLACLARVDRQQHMALLVKNKPCKSYGRKLSVPSYLRQNPGVESDVSLEEGQLASFCYSEVLKFEQCYFEA
jgi:hypothetical protein